MRRIAALAVVLFLGFRPVLAADSIQTILDSLQGEYNPVLVSFLLEEGKAKLSQKQQSSPSISNSRASRNPSTSNHLKK